MRFKTLSQPLATASKSATKIAAKIAPLLGLSTIAAPVFAHSDAGSAHLHPHGGEPWLAVMTVAALVAIYLLGRKGQ